jgi:[ribosomal protein S5]-alanine N-acetyltransferase
MVAPFEGPQPVLHAPRLVLRPFEAADADAVERLLADPEIAEGTLTIPHPYPPGSAGPWIATHAESWRAGTSGTWAVTRRPRADAEAGAASGALVGAMSLRFVPRHRKAEVGYWIARAEWGRGYATEALARLLDFAFGDAGLHRVEAHHFVENPASGRVMQRAGMRAEGTRRGAVVRQGVPRDVVEYGILASDPRPRPG